MCGLYAEQLPWKGDGADREIHLAEKNTEKQISNLILFQINTYLNCWDAAAQQISEAGRNGLGMEEESSEI